MPHLINNAGNFAYNRKLPLYIRNCQLGASAILTQGHFFVILETFSSLLRACVCVPLWSCALSFCRSFPFSVSDNVWEDTAWELLLCLQLFAVTFCFQWEFVAYQWKHFAYIRKMSLSTSTDCEQQEHWASRNHGWVHGECSQCQASTFRTLVCPRFVCKLQQTTQDVGYSGQNLLPMCWNFQGCGLSCKTCWIFYGFVGSSAIWRCRTSRIFMQWLKHAGFSFSFLLDDVKLTWWISWSLVFSCIANYNHWTSDALQASVWIGGWLTI